MVPRPAAAARVGPTKAKRAVSALGLLADGEDSDVLLRWPLALAELPAAAHAQAEAVARAVGTKQAEPLRQAVAPLIRANYDNAEERLVDLDLLVEAARTVPACPMWPPTTPWSRRVPPATWLGCRRSMRTG